ncbi:MAG: NCS2 family permease [bacterium]
MEEVKKEKTSLLDKVLSFFKVKERGTTFSKEVVGGLTTFLAMAYILGVNPSMLSAGGMDFGAVFTATAIAAIFGTLVMGLLANLPIALAPGMGLNAFFTYTVIFGLGYSWQQALIGVLISGILFLILSLTGIRKKVIKAIPKDLKLAVGAGIGLFIAYVGLQGSGLIVFNESTVSALGDLTSPTVLLAIAGLLITIVLYILKVPGSILIGIVSTTILGLIFGQIEWNGFASMPSAPPLFELFDGFGEGVWDLRFVAVVFSLLFVDFFDTTGTIVSVGHQAGLLNEEGEILNGEKALVVDAASTVVGALVGTSSTTAYIESLSGIEAGAKTGLANVVTALLFCLALFLSPFFAMVQGFCTAGALIFVGILMAKQLGEIDWKDNVVAITAFLVILLMPLTYSIATGLAIGFIFYPLAMIASKRAKEVNIIMYILMIFFIIYFLVNTLVF